MRFSGKAANVLLAKCRARYGRRLTYHDIEALVGCRSVSDAAAYLKATERYGAALRSLDENGLHRRQLEAALDNHLYTEFYALSRCELSVGDWFGEYLLMRVEIKQIMSFLWLLFAGRQHEYILSMPEYFLQRSGLEPAALAACHDYGDFLAAMRHSRFIKVLRTYQPLPDEKIDCALIEHALYSQFYDNLYRIIDKHYSGKAHEELMELIGTRIDMQNFQHICRLKRFYGSDPAMARSMIYRQEHRIKQRIMLEMVNAPDVASVKNIFVTQTPYGRRLDRAELDEAGGLEAATARLVQQRAQKLMRASINPASVMLAYILMAEAEVHDIIAIVEGIYYGLSRETILDMVTIDELAAVKANS